MDKTQIYLRSKKRAALKKIEEGLEDLTGKLSVKIYKNSAIKPRGQIINIQQSKNQYTVIDDIDYCSDIIPCETPNEEITILYGGYFRHQWGHFLLNSTARLWWLIENQTNMALIDKIIFISTPGEKDCIDGNYREFFELLGIFDKIEIIKNSNSYQKIIVPDISYEHDKFYAKEMIGVFNKIKENSSLCGTSNNYKEFKKIFLTRSKLPGAKYKEFNLFLFDNLWEDNGFKVIAPEKVPLKQLVQILKQAEIIVSVSGSTAHNLVFASSEASITIMERVATINDFQIGISKIFKQNIRYVDCFLYPIIPIPTGNVFYYFPTSLFQNFFNDKKLKFFNDKILKKFYRNRNVFKFFSSYKKQSGHFLGLSDNTYDLESIAEAYLETSHIFGEAMKSESYFQFLLKKSLSKLKRILKL